MHKKANSITLVLICCIILLFLVYYNSSRLERSFEESQDISFEPGLDDIMTSYFEQCMDLAYEKTVSSNGYETDAMIIDPIEGVSEITDSFDYHFTLYFKDCLRGVYGLIEERGYTITIGDYGISSSITQSFADITIHYPHIFEKQGSVQKLTDIEKTYPRLINLVLEQQSDENRILFFSDKLSYIKIPGGTKIFDIHGNEVSEIKLSISGRDVFGLENDNVLGETTYNISPDVFFSQPVELVLHFPLSNPIDNESSESARIGWLNEKVNIWMMQNTTLQRNGDYYEAKAKINHASIWAILSGPCGIKSEKIQLDMGGEFDFGRYSAECISTNMDPNEPCVLNGKYDNYFYFEKDGTLNQPLSCEIRGPPGSVIRKLKCNEGEIQYTGPEFFDVPPYDRQNYLYDKVIRDSICKDNFMITINGIENEVDGYTDMICAGGFIEANEQVPFIRRYVFPNNGDVCLNDYPGAVLNEDMADSDDSIVLLSDNLKPLNLKGIIEGCSEGAYYSKFDDGKYYLCESNGECKGYSTVDEKTRNILEKKNPGYQDWLDHINADLEKDIQLSDDEKKGIISFIDSGQMDNSLKKKLENGRSLCNSKEAFHVISDYNEYGDALAIDLTRLEVINDHSFDIEHADVKAKIENYYFQLEEGANAKDSIRVCFEKGTKIAVPGGYASIEDIRPGDYVLSYDLKTQKTEFQAVDETYIRVTEKIVHVVLEDGSYLNVTPDHPFYDGTSYRPIVDFKAGEYLFSIGGKLKRIEAIFQKKVKKMEVYNLKVQKNNNYFAEGILVHNQGYENALNCLYDGSDDDFGLSAMFEDYKEEIEKKISADFPGFTFNRAQLAFCSTDCKSCINGKEDNPFICNHLSCQAYMAGQLCLVKDAGDRIEITCNAKDKNFEVTFFHELVHVAQNINMRESDNDYVGDENKYYNKHKGEKDKNGNEVDALCASPSKLILEAYADYISGDDRYMMTWPGDEHLDNLEPAEWFGNIQAICPSIDVYSVGANPTEKNVDELFDCCAAKLGISECWHRFRLLCSDCYVKECGPEDVPS